MRPLASAAFSALRGVCGGPGWTAIRFPALGAGAVRNFSAEGVTDHTAQTKPGRRGSCIMRGLLATSGFQDTGASFGAGGGVTRQFPWRPLGA